ncbi:hypothetical protein EZS27_004721 [termite gut metagenome]|uniref:Uncharacterized protein n=1 Tax=termite gut metagenome TaxID=433724 RepID=A0A5J4SP77_9ZZZZ
MIKKRYIEIELIKKKELAGEFKISVRAVYDALNYKTQSGTAKAIRAAALQRGGRVYVPEDFGKNFERAACKD